MARTARSGYIPRSRADRGYVIHGGDVELPLGPDATAWPFGRL